MPLFYFSGPFESKFCNNNSNDLIDDGRGNNCSGHDRAREASISVNVVTAMPVNTKDTPELGNNVKPRYFVIVGSAFVIFPPKYAPPIFLAALESVYIAVNSPAPAIRR